MSENILSEITNWLKSIVKAGDVEGHEFHGNQYSQGGGSTGGGKTDVAPTREGDPHRYATEGRWGQEPTKTELGTKMKRPLLAPRAILRAQKSTR